MIMVYTHNNAPSPEFDSEGFLKDPRTWSEPIAEAIATRDGLATLTPKHWDVIRSLRAHYEKFGTVASAHSVCHSNHMGNYCIDELFGEDHKEVLKVAGIADPGEETKSYI